MKQLVQDLRSGELSLLEVPAPRPAAGQVLIQATRSLISAGTERMLTNFAKAGYLEKARMQPERLGQLIEKVRTDGLWSAIESVRARLNQPMALGYCHVGRVIEIGDRVPGLSVGDRVVSNSPHVEVALAPRNLCARIPDGVTDDQAAFAVVAAIGLQGVRLIAPTVGETIVISGLGLIGLLTVQVLKAAGCRVLGFDPDESRVALARRHGADAFNAGSGNDPVAVVSALTGGEGADAVLIAASTDDDALISQCAAMCRKRGRIVLTGVIGLDLRRSDFYEKELTFQVSCSYGPGRYDTAYEEGGIDYPRPFVRWTAGRNFEAVLELMREGRIETGTLVTDRVPFASATTAYERLDDPSSIGILLDYGTPPDRIETPARSVTGQVRRTATTGNALAVIGAGHFTQRRILPSLHRAGADVRIIASVHGMSAAIAARKFRIPVATTDIESVMQDPEIAGVVIATLHDSHAALVVNALESGKHVFVEKPLCLTEAELERIVTARDEAASRFGAAPAVVVGFNRRFAPLARKMRQGLAGRSGPAFVTYTCNAGTLPADHWAHDPLIGGGRIIGEACHFIDFIQYLVGGRIVSVNAARTKPAAGDLQDSAAITIGFEDGSVGQVNYFSCGHPSFPKERCEAAFDGKCLVLNNFRRLEAFGVPLDARSMRQDKGHGAQFAAFHRLISGLDPPEGFPVAFDVIEDVTRATITAARSMQQVSVRNAAT